MTIAIILNTKKGNHFLIALLLVARSGFEPETSGL